VDLATVLAALTEGLVAFTWANAAMLPIGSILIYLVITR
jgi:Na+-transporting methylmalonyl-CoA/oxaloacetate decarboxylase beta subunit